jgi:N-acetylglutamate synthase
VLGPEDLGYRVVVRRILGIRDNRPIYGDLLGELVDVSGTHVTVRSAEGTVTVERRAIAAAKRVPDRRAASATERLERVAAAGWPAAVQQPLGDWLLRATDGWTNRGNSALALGVPGRPLPEAVDAVVAWYRARDLLPRIMVPAPVGGRVTAELRRRGWVPQRPVLVQTAPLAAVVAATPAAAEVRLDEVPPGPWLDLVADWKGRPPAAALRLLTAGGRARFASLDAERGALSAVGRGVVPDPRWLGLALVEVVPAQRRRGRATAIVGALARWAAGLGADRSYLQVEAHNDAAVALYARLGFTTHHTYTTWHAPD